MNSCDPTPALLRYSISRFTTPKALFSKIFTLSSVSPLL